jgi:hypothetical protein
MQQDQDAQIAGQDEGEPSMAVEPEENDANEENNENEKPSEEQPLIAPQRKSQPLAKRYTWISLYVFFIV